MMEKFILPRGYLSASAISTLLRCPKQYEFRYIHDIVAPPSVALIVGSATHATFEGYFSDYLVSKKRMTAKDVADMSVSKLEEEITKKDLKLSGTEFDNTVSEVRTLTKDYVEYVACEIEPASVEDEFRFVTDFGVEILGYIDLKNQLSVSDGSENLGIIDYKITGKKWNKSKLENSLQFNLYVLGTGITDISIHNLIKGTKTKVLSRRETEAGVVDLTSNIRIISHKFDDTESEHFTDLIYQSAKLITSGIFSPCDPEAWCCNETWCGYWHYCRGKRKETTLTFDYGSTSIGETICDTA